AYWVCPLIGESDELRAQAAEETAAGLAEAVPAVRWGLVHGRMPAAAKDRAMLAFQAGRVQLLIATTVIEVGVDVPNATLMVIDNAERMGLAQLHQLRGRVGRGPEASTCVLLYRAPLSPLARERLRVIRRSSDGFEIARRDLELRGPGELLGTRQTGLAQLRVADLMRDADLLPRVQQTAELLLASYPDNIAALTARWIGAGERYGRVMSLPAGRRSAHVGYKPSMVIGLLIAALGALAFYPAAKVPSYPLFLLALFVLATGITLLQVAANPYISLLGEPRGASSRLTLAQALNSLGHTLSPALIGPLILSVAVLGSAELARLPQAQQEAYRIVQAQSVQLPYLAIAGGLLLLASCVYLFRLPPLTEATERADPHPHTFSEV